MKPHEERVVVEKHELDEKIVRLAAFIQSEAFDKVPASEQSLLREQHGTMIRYSDILGERIDVFISRSIEVAP